MPKASDHRFTPIEDEKTVARYIQYMHDLNSEVHCAVRETDVRFDTASIRIVDAKIVHLKMRNDLLSPDQLKKKVDETDAQRIDISYHAHDILVFASTKLRKVDKDGISLEVERPIYKLQRRQHLRVKPGSDVKCKLSVHNPRDGQHHEYFPYDISVGGFAVMMKEKEAAAYEVGDQIPKVWFLFGAHTVVVDAVVKNKAPIKGPRATNIKVGFTIAQMPTALEHEISRYAYLQSQKILGRRI